MALRRITSAGTREAEACSIMSTNRSIPNGSPAGRTALDDPVGVEHHRVAGLERGRRPPPPADHRDPRAAMVDRGAWPSTRPPRTWSGRGWPALVQVSRPDCTSSRASWPVTNRSPPKLLGEDPVEPFMDDGQRLALPAVVAVAPDGQ